MIFWDGKDILWNAQIAPDRTHFIKIFPGEHAPGPPYHGSASLLLQGYLCACFVVLSLGILVHVYEGRFEEYRSDTYFDENKEGRIAIIVKRRLFMVTSHFVKKYLV